MPCWSVSCGEARHPWDIAGMVMDAREGLHEQDTPCRPSARARRRGSADVPPRAGAVEIVLRVHDTFRNAGSSRPTKAGAESPPRADA